MKNEKFCFSKGTGLIALVGVLLVGFVLLTQMANNPTSTNSRASGPTATCESKGGKWTTNEACSAYLARLYPTTSPLQANYKVTDETANVALPSYRGANDKCCVLAAAVSAFDCTTVQGTLKEKLLNTSNNMWACTYYTGGVRTQSLYTNTAAGDCKVTVKNNAQCAGYDANVVDGLSVTPFVTPNTMSQQQYCQTLANKVASLIEYKDFNGTKQTTGCTYFKPTGTPRNPANQTGKDNCRVDQTNDSSRCGAVGTALAAAGNCSTKRCWNGNIADGVCHNKQACECVTDTSKTELPKLNVCE